MAVVQKLEGLYLEPTKLYLSKISHRGLLLEIDCLCILLLSRVIAVRSTHKFNIEG